MKDGTYTTIVRTANGKTYDLSKHEYPPSKCSTHGDESSCEKCLVVNAYTELVETPGKKRFDYPPLLPV